MMNEVKFADLLEALDECGMAQLDQALERIIDRKVERQERFEQLCAGLYDYLHCLNEEFPNSSVYLVKDGQPDVDLMDYIIPKEMWKICKIGD